MRLVLPSCAALAALAAVPHLSRAGPYTEAGISSSSPSIVGWATAANLTRGPQDIANPGGPAASFGVSTDALGPADGSAVVSLGDGGQITLGFATLIGNGPGPDFAVFENAFVVGSGPNIFAELGYVEISSDNVNFFRFASDSLTQNTEQITNAGSIDATDIHNLAGKHLSNLGTPFDLNELVGVSALLNVNAITSVRIIDVVGRISAGGGYTPRVDASGDIINDPYTTTFPTGGFDLDAVGVMNVPEPTSAAVFTLGLLAARRRRARA